MKRLLISCLIGTKHSDLGSIREGHQNGPWKACRSLPSRKYLPFLRNHVLLLDYDHCRIQLHQDVDWFLFAATGGPNKMAAVHDWHAK